MPALQKAKVVVIGELFVDHIFSEFNSFPKLGEESFARRYHKEVGGGAAITACALAKLGVEVAVIGDMIGVRDSKVAPDGTVLLYTRHEWAAFLDGAKKGEFDKFLD